ncbi:P-loop NTPase fold protein [Vibrio lentus]|uniref:KAP family P-loop NTPase fold protein n=1 Tax=Vibrio lentus TaxID=136468 RepID=UPI00355329E1
MSAIGVGTYLSGKMDNGAIVEAAKTLTFSDTDAVQIGRNLTDNYKAQLSAIEDTKEVLGHYLEYFNKDKRKVFVLVDELDRCRPTYAIEMLETIKHFFSLDNYIFVVATDTNQLSHSIKAVYGSEFDGTEYLSRFFNRSAALPEPDKSLFAKLLVNDSLLVEIDVKMVSDLEYSVEFLAKLLHEVSTMYDLSLRRMEQVFRKLESCILYELDTENRYFDIRLLIQLIAEYDSAEFHICYQARKGFNGKHYTLPKSFKHKLDVETDDILDITTNLRQKEIKKIEPNNPEYLVQLRQNYKFSWDFANSFNDTPQSKTIMISECYRALNQEKQSFQTRNGYNVSGREELYGALLFDRFDHFNRLYQLGKGNEQAWTRNDYLKAVELSSMNSI